MFQVFSSKHILSNDHYRLPKGTEVKTRNKTRPGSNENIPPLNAAYKLNGKLPTTKKKVSKKELGNQETIVLYNMFVLISKKKTIFFLLGRGRHSISIHVFG
jgi:hypothetical protein